MFNLKGNLQQVRRAIQHSLGAHILLRVILARFFWQSFWQSIKSKIYRTLFVIRTSTRLRRKKTHLRDSKKAIESIHRFEQYLHLYLKNGNMSSLWIGVKDLESLGHMFAASKRLDLAEHCLIVVAKFRPTNSVAGINNLRHLGIIQFMRGYLERAKKSFEQVGLAQQIAFSRTRTPINYRVLGKSWFAAIGHVAMIDILLKKRELGYCEAVKQFIVTEDTRNLVGKVILDGFLEHGVISIWPESLQSYCSPQRKNVNSQVKVAPDWDQLHLDEQENMATEFWDYSFPDGGIGLFYAHAAAKIQGEWERSQRSPLLTLHSHQRKGIGAILKTLGIPENAWYVCLHVRESGFHNKWNRIYPSARDANVDDYSAAMQAIIERGGWVIRMGDASMKLLHPVPGVIDYVHTTLKSEEGDTLLVAGCRFMLCTNSGLSIIPATYGVPCVLTNWIPIAIPNWYGTDLMIPKLMRSKLSGQLLDFEAMFDEPLGAIQNVFDFPDDIEIVENTPEEIRAVTVEMMDRLDGKPYSIDEDALQDRYFNLAVRKGSYRGSRLGRDFLDKYKILLPEKTK